MVESPRPESLPQPTGRLRPIHLIGPSGPTRDGSTPAGPATRFLDPLCPPLSSLNATLRSIGPAPPERYYRVLSSPLRYYDSTPKLARPCGPLQTGRIDARL